MKTPMDTDLEKLFADKDIAYSFKTVLQYYLDNGGKVVFLSAEKDQSRAFIIVSYKGVDIFLRSRNCILFTVFNSYLSVSATFDKLLMHRLLKFHNIRTPDTWLYGDQKEQIEEWLAGGARLVVKPRLGSHGDGVSMDVTDAKKLRAAVKYARQFHSQVIVQRQVGGNEYRLLFLDFKLVAAARRHAPYVDGDGKSTIKELIDQENTRRFDKFKLNDRQKWHQLHILGIRAEEVARQRGEKFLNEIPAQGERIVLFEKRNVGLGALVEDVTELVNPKTAKTYSNFLKTLDLRFCGMDIITPDISSPPAEAEVIELNTRPGLIMHAEPHIGEKRDVPKLLAKALYQTHKSLQKTL